MKTVGRIVIILVAALIVIGAAYAIAQTSAAQALAGQPMDMGERGDRQSPPGFANGQDNQAGAMTGRPEGGREGSGLDTLGQNLLKIAAIIVVVQALSIERRLKLAKASLVRKGRLDPSRSS